MEKDLLVIETLLKGYKTTLETLKAEYDKAYDVARAKMKVVDEMENATQGTYTNAEIDKAYAEYDEKWHKEKAIDDEIYRYENIIDHLKEAYDYMDNNY